MNISKIKVSELRSLINQQPQSEENDVLMDFIKSLPPDKSLFRGASTWHSFALNAMQSFKPIVPFVPFDEIAETDYSYRPIPDHSGKAFILTDGLRVYCLIKIPHGYDEFTQPTLPSGWELKRRQLPEDVQLVVKKEGRMKKMHDDVGQQWLCVNATHFKPSLTL